MKTTMLAFVCGLVLLATHNAYALTIPSGSVIGSDGVVAPAHETAHGKSVLANDGVLVAAGNVIISLNGDVVVIPVTEFVGKSRGQIAELIGEHATEQLSDMYDAQTAHAAELAAAGVDAVVATGKSIDEIVSEIDADATVGAVIGVTSDAVANQIGDRLGDFVPPEYIGREHEYTPSN